MKPRVGDTVIHRWTNTKYKVLSINGDLYNLARPSSEPCVLGAAVWTVSQYYIEQVFTSVWGDEYDE